MSSETPKTEMPLSDLTLPLGICMRSGLLNFHFLLNCHHERLLGVDLLLHGQANRSIRLELAHQWTQLLKHASHHCRVLGLCGGDWTPFHRRVLQPQIADRTVDPRSVSVGVRLHGTMGPEARPLGWLRSRMVRSRSKVFFGGGFGAFLIASRTCSCRSS